MQPAGPPGSFRRNDPHARSNVVVNSTGIIRRLLAEMTPAAFTFKVSVPNDARLVTVIGELAQHAAEYAKLDAGAASAFMERAQALATKAMKVGAANAITAVIAAANGQLTVTVGGESASQPL